MEFLQQVGNVSSLPAGPPDEIYYKIENVLAAFYMVRPSRAMYASIEEVPNFFNMVIKIGPLLFLIEYILLLVQGKKTYRWNDSITGVSALLVGAIPLAFVEAGLFTIYAWFYERFRIVDLPWDSLWTWLLCMPALELSNYVAHRLAHEVNFIWAQHQVHHSAQDLAFPAGIRFSLVDKLVIDIHCLPWALLIPPGCAKAHHSLNLVYQMWVHSKAIPLLGPIELIFETPQQHIIHHGINRFCVDKNYGGFLNIWDQVFGTMVWPHYHQDRKIQVGLVQKVTTWDIFYLYTYPFRDNYRRMVKYDKLSDKIGVLINGPGWEPGKPRLGYYEDIAEEPVVEYYDRQSPWYVYIYCILHVAVVWFTSAIVVERYWIMPVSMQMLAHLFVVWTVCNIGYVLEHKTFAPALEWTRCAMFFVLEIVIGPSVFVHFPAMAMTAVRILCALTVMMWTFNFNYYAPKSKVE